MAIFSWQVGLDIQNGHLSALAVKARRQGWSLCHWWQHPLPHDTLTQGMLQGNDELIHILKTWRRRLPKTYSLRVGFPPHRTLQHDIPVPDKKLKEPVRSQYITSAMKRHFPLNSDTLTFDYRESPTNLNAFSVTAAYQRDISEWRRCLKQAGLNADVLELTPGALRCMARASTVSDHAWVIHRLSDHWIWSAPVNLAFRCGWGAAETFPTARQLHAHLSESFPDHFPVEIAYSTTVADDEAPSGWSRWQPLNAFRYRYPPLPTCADLFVIAGGLAIRPSDDR